MAQEAQGTSGELALWSRMVAGLPTEVTAGLGTQGGVKHGSGGQPTCGAGPDLSARAWVGASTVDLVLRERSCAVGMNLRVHVSMVGRQVCWIRVCYKALGKRRLSRSQEDLIMLYHEPWRPVG